MASRLPSLVVIGDTHFGSTVGLLPPRVILPDGQKVAPSATQKRLWGYWKDFWHFVEQVTGNDYILIHNGDLVDGRHHETLQVVSGALQWQQFVAEGCMREHVERAKAYYQIAGTPAHSGNGHETEEAAARALGAFKNTDGRHVSQTLWIQYGGQVIHFAHHIPTSSAHAYKSSPSMRLIAQAFADAGERGLKPPNILVRSHVHDYIEVKRAGCRAVVCPCWQAKTDWVWKKDTISEPVIGGLVIKRGEYGVHIREFTRTLPRPTPIVIR